MEDAQLKRKLFQWKYPTIELQWVAKSLKWGHAGWIDYDELQTLRRREKMNLEKREPKKKQRSIAR